MVILLAAAGTVVNTVVSTVVVADTGSVVDTVVGDHSGNHFRYSSFRFRFHILPRCCHSDVASDTAAAWQRLVLERVLHSCCHSNCYHRKVGSCIRGQCCNLKNRIAQ